MNENNSVFFIIGIKTHSKSVRCYKIFKTSIKTGFEFKHFFRFCQSGFNLPTRNILGFKKLAQHTNIYTHYLSIYLSDGNPSPEGHEGFLFNINAFL